MALQESTVVVVPGQSPNNRSVLLEILEVVDIGAHFLERSNEAFPAARAKATEKRTPDGLSVHSFWRLIAAVATTLTRNRIQSAAEGAVATDILASPIPVRAEASASSMSSLETYLDMMD